MNPEGSGIKSVKVEQPKISKTNSLRSASASEEYFSDYASDNSSKTHLTGAQYETPPSKLSTPITHQQQPIDSEMTLPSRPTVAHPAPLNVRSNYFGNGDERGRVRESLNARSWLNMSPPTPGLDDTPYIRFAIEQLTRDEELSGRGRQGSPNSVEFPIQRIIPDEGLGYYGPPAPPSEPPKQPDQPPSQPGTFAKKPIKGEILLPVAPPEGTQWSDLGFIPLVLRLPLLLLLLLICLLAMAGVIFSNVYSQRNHGFIDYDGISTSRYFIFQFLPQLLGILIIIWLMVVQAAIYRILPFLSLSSEKPHKLALQGMPILSANFVLPDLTYFRTGEPLMGLVLSIFWLTNFTVPLLACLYQTQWIVGHGTPRWRWTSVQGVGWMLLVIYVLLTAAVVLCIIRFRKQASALSWDPVSLADLIPLFRKSNILSDFERSEITGSVRTSIPPKQLRLGYWTVSNGHEIFHTLGEANAPTPRQSFQPSPLNEKRIGIQKSNSMDVERQRNSYASSFSRTIHSPFVRFRWVPWFLRDSAVLAWIIVAILLLIAFLVVSFVHSAVQRGFEPLLPSITRNGGFSASNFLYSFLPALLGMFLFLAWQPIDTYFRAIQPFTNLSNQAGAVAERSLLLDYPSLPPGVITFRAIVNQDLLVAWISFVSLMAITIPVIAGGIFTAQNFPAEHNQVRIVAAIPAYYVLCIFVSIYVLSFLAIWPTRKRYLPHSIRTIAELLSFLYQSPILTDPAFINVKTKADLVERLVFPPKGSDMAGNVRSSARYAFGIYNGRDGREHLGIDRLQRPGSGEMLVTTGMTR